VLFGNFACLGASRNNNGFAAFASKWDNSVVVSSSRHPDEGRENDVRGVADAPLRG
jgi:hypothetical protein